VAVVGKAPHADTLRRSSTVDDVAAEITGLGRRALTLRVDLRDEAACEAAVACAIAHFGHVDALVNSAGALWWADVAETPVKKFDLVVGVNVRAAFVLSHALLPHMMQRRWGHIVMMSPPVDVAACGHHGAFAVSKFGMTMLAHAIAEEAAEHNVTAHALWPATAIENDTTDPFPTDRSPSDGASLAGGRDSQAAEWRSPDILGDATVALLAREPSSRPGRAWIDETVLCEEGVTDFRRYRAVRGVLPRRVFHAAPPNARNREEE
jgi:citronellol/citronellal dehydrogenase